MKCTVCNEDVTQLRVYVLEENKYELEYNPARTTPDWSTSEVVDMTAERMSAQCGNCHSDISLGTWLSGPNKSTAWGKDYWGIDYVEWIEHLMEVNKDA